MEDDAFAFPPSSSGIPPVNQSESDSLSQTQKTPYNFSIVCILPRFQLTQNY